MPIYRDKPRHAEFSFCIFARKYHALVLIGGSSKPGQQETAQAAPVAAKGAAKPKIEAKAAPQEGGEAAVEAGDMSASMVTYKQAETMCRRAAGASARYGFDPDLWSITSNTNDSRTSVIASDQLTNAFGTELQTNARCEVNLTTDSVVSITFDQ
jgi:hypothetical protein